MVANPLDDPDVVAAEVREMMAECLTISAIQHYRRRCEDSNQRPASKIEWNLRVLAEEIAYRTPFAPEMNVLDAEPEFRTFAQWRRLTELV